MDQKIIDKIQNLLNMTVENGCSENEAATAVRLAQELLMKHNLSMEQVVCSGSQERESVQADSTQASYLHQGQWEWQVALARCVAEVTCCKLLVSKDTGRRPWYYWWVGTETNTKVAGRLFNWLTVQMVDIAVRARQKAYDMRGKPIVVDGVVVGIASKYIGKNYLRSYLLGMTYRVTERLREHFRSMVQELNAQDYILARYDEAEAKANEMSGGKNLKARSNADLNRDGFRHGQRNGNKVKLDREESLNGVDLGPKALGGRA